MALWVAPVGGVRAHTPHPCRSASVELLHSQQGAPMQAPHPGPRTEERLCVRVLTGFAPQVLNRSTVVLFHSAKPLCVIAQIRARTDC